MLPKPAGAAVSKPATIAPAETGSLAQFRRTLKVLGVLHNVTDVPLDEITPDSILEDTRIYSPGDGGLGRNSNSLRL